MAWETQPLETAMFEALIRDYGASTGESLKALYVLARDKIVYNIIPGIPGAEPGLSDHTQMHVENVLSNAYRLIGLDGSSKPPYAFSGADLYCLCLCVLFHDTGNIFRREGHETRIDVIYHWVRSDVTGVPPTERNIVIKIAGAHTGTAASGSKDTIGSLPKEPFHLKGVPVQQREIAAVLRLADELAEGPQRTYAFVKEVIGYPSESQIYHDYAKITDVAIDRGNGRIALNYNVLLDSRNGDITLSLEWLRELLDFTFKRVEKLDAERQYTKFYSDCLAPFVRTSVHLEIWVDGKQALLGLDPLELSDMRVPGESPRPLHELNPNYDPSRLCEAVNGLLVAGGTE